MQIAEAIQSPARRLTDEERAERARARAKRARERRKALGIKRVYTEEQLAHRREVTRAYYAKNREKLRAQNREHCRAYRRRHAEAIRAKQAQKRAEAGIKPRAKGESAEAKANRLAKRAEEARIAAIKRAAKARSRARRLEREREERAIAREAKRVARLEREQAKLAHATIRIVRPLEGAKPMRSVMSLWEGKRVPEGFRATVAAAEHMDAMFEKSRSAAVKGRREYGPAVLDGIPLAGRTSDLFPIYRHILRPSKANTLPAWGGKVRCSLHVEAADIWGGGVVFLPTYENLKIKSPKWPWRAKTARMQINGMKGLALWLEQKT